MLQPRCEHCRRLRPQPDEGLMELGQRAAGPHRGSEFAAFVTGQPPAAHGQLLKAAGDATAQQRWHTAKTPLQLGGEAMAVVPAKQLITTITRKSHGEATAAGFPADQMSGQLGGISEGFAVELGKLRDQGAGIGGRECYFGVVGAEMGRHRSGSGMKHGRGSRRTRRSPTSPRPRPSSMRPRAAGTSTRARLLWCPGRTKSSSCEL